MPPDDPKTYLTPAVSDYPLGVDSIEHGVLRVPSHGFSAHNCLASKPASAAEKLYVVFSSFSDATFSNPLRSVLAYSCNEGQSFVYLYDLSDKRFINGSSVIVDNASFPGLPEESGSGLLLWGSGEYRKSDVYLAFVPLDDVEDRGAGWYYRHLDTPGTGVWVKDENLATPVLQSSRSPDDPTPCVGELSVTWNQFLKKWLLLYNCNGLKGPSQVRLHVADLPWGPWSDLLVEGPGGSSTVIFDPERDQAFGSFMHEANVNDGLDDNMFFPDVLSRYDTPGDPYGPYVISRYTKGDNLSTIVYYTMSTWNAYQVMLMKSKLRLQRPPVADAGDDQTVSADDQCLGHVTLDASASSDPDDDPLSFKWSGPFGTTTGAKPNVVLPLGENKISLEVDDGLGGKATDDVTDEVTVQVEDTTDPVVTVALSPRVLWPPNHMLSSITADVQTSDNCDPAPAVRLRSLVSSEPDNGLGDGDTSGDIQGAAIGADDRDFLLRAERSGTGPGRVYEIVYDATDESGNIGRGVSTATVPHDR